MLEAFHWHKPTAMQHAAHSLAQAGKAPLVIGSIAAMAILGMLTRMGINHGGGRGRAKVIPARFRSAAQDAVSSAPRNGRRRRKRKMKMKAAAH